MAEILVAPDGVSLMIAWLTAELPSIPDQAPVGVYRDVPKSRPTAFVTVRQSGGPGREGNVPLDRQLLTIDAYASAAPAARDLAQAARAVAWAARGVVHAGVQCYRVEDGGAPVDLPDPLAPDLERSRFLIQLTLRIRRRPQGVTP